MDKAKTCMFTLFQKISGVTKEQLEGMQKSSFFPRRNNSENTYMSEKLQTITIYRREITSISCDREKWYATDLCEIVFKGKMY